MHSKTEGYLNPRTNYTIGRTTVVNGKKIQNQYDTLDLQATSIMLKEEQNCVKSFNRPVPWSVAPVKTSTAIKY